LADAPALGASEAEALGAPEKDTAVLGTVDGDPSAPVSWPPGWHAVTNSAAEAATIAIAVPRMPFPYCMTPPISDCTAPALRRQSPREMGSPCAGFLCEPPMDHL
jgi:hypothetical protein